MHVVDLESTIDPKVLRVRLSFYFVGNVIIISIILHEVTILFTFY